MIILHQGQLDMLDYENAPESHINNFYKDCEEELNVLYVALTRSNNCLYLNKDLTEYCKRKGILWLELRDVYVDKTYPCQLPLRNGIVLNVVDNGS